VGLSRPVVDRLIKSVPEKPVGFQRDNLVSETIGTAFYNLGFNRAKADNIGSYLIKQNPSIDGTIYDETPNRKTRTELTARATSFTTNQRLYGGNTSTGKTALSVFAWVRPTTLSGSKGIIAEYNPTGNQRGYFMQFLEDELRVVLTSDGISNSKGYRSNGYNFTVGVWYLVGFIFDSNTLSLWVSGIEVNTTKTTDNTVNTIFDSSEPLEIGSGDGGANYFDGQIQTPLIWESALSAAEVRDLYLGKYDQLTTPDYGWFLDGVTAHKLTSGSPALTAANTPTRYEDELAPDYLNLHGWNESGGTVYPKRINSNVDSNGNPPDNAHSFGECKRNFQLLDGPCFSFGGTEYATNGNLVGTETVVSSEGTSTPTISAGRIDFTAGTCWNLLLSNGSHYAGSEEAGIIWHDDVNDEHLTFVNTPSWGTQDSYFWSEAVGYSLYEHASTADIFVPLKSDGTALSITPPSGYTKTSDNPAGSYHNDSPALLEEFPVTDSGSQRDVFYAAEFNGTTSEIDIDDAKSQLSTASDFGGSLVFRMDDGTNQTLLSSATSTNDRFSISYQSLSIRISARNAGSTVSKSIAFSGGSDTDFHKISWVYDSSSHSITAYLDGVEMTGTSSASPLANVGAKIGATTAGTFPLNGAIKNLSINGGLDMPLYKDSLDRSVSCNHGVETDITYLSEARATNLNPTISETNTRAVTTGDRKIIRIGQQ